jgi:putative ABC transport system ATP-binding protein
MPPVISHPDAVRLEAVSKVYGRGAGAVEALRGVTLALADRTFTAIMGPSGSGKSTLLHCAAGLDVGAGADHPAGRAVR